MARIKFVTDSAADIPAALREEAGVQVLPFPIAVEDKEYQDGVDFTPQEFYDILLTTPKIPTHSQLNPYDFQQCYEDAWKAGYSDLIYTAINYKGSATQQNAIQAREEFFEDHPEAEGKFRIYIINSRNYTMGYGWPVLEGVHMAQAGAGAEEIAAHIQDLVDRVHVVFSPLDLRFAKKSGRVSAAAAFVGEALGLKPIMTFTDGDSKILAKVRGEKSVISSMVDMCRKERCPGTPYLLIQGNNTEQSEKLAQAAAQTLGEEAALAYFIGGVVSINAGPNLIGLVYWS